MDSGGFLTPKQENKGKLIPNNIKSNLGWNFKKGKKKFKDRKNFYFY